MLPVSKRLVMASSPTQNAITWQAGAISAELMRRRQHAARAVAVAKRRAAQALLPKPSPADLAARLQVCASLVLINVMTRRCPCMVTHFAL